jgi:hypothetical protein
MPPAMRRATFRWVAATGPPYTRVDRTETLMPSKKQLKSFAERVRHLIDTHLDGNVAKAAREMGVSQRALHSIYSGETLDPRLTMIQAVLKRFPAEDARVLLLGESSLEGRRGALKASAADIANALWDEFEKAVQALAEADSAGVHASDQTASNTARVVFVPGRNRNPVLGVGAASDRQIKSKSRGKPQKNRRD